MCWLWVLLFLGGASGYKILALSPLCSKSHVIAYAPLLNELTARGHQVTAVVPYNVPSLSNGVQVLTDDSLKELAWGIFQYQFSETLGTTWNAISDELGFFEVSIQTCPKLLETPTVARLMQTVERGSFDYVLLTTHVANECMFGFINRLKVPFGYFFSAGDLPWSSVAVGNPIPTSFVPYLASVYGDRMNFVERMMNFGFTWAVQATRQRTYSQVEPIVREAFKWSPEDPSIPELEKNVSLVVLNQDQRLFQYPGPTMPNMIEIGGAHCRPPKRLPKNLKTWFDKTGAGNVIFFSMGSAVSSNNFPKQKWQAFVQAFQRVSRTLEVRILLKWDGQVEELAEDANFLVLPWIPQQDVLGHEKVKLFITHGGLLSSQETTFHAVPILGIPVGADQMMNLKRISDADAGKMLLWGDITTQRLVSDITDVLTDPKYAKAAKQRSAIMKDREEEPAAKGAFWIEYAIRNHGAPHLRSAGRFLPWYQYYMLDVYMVIFVAIYLLFFIFKTSIVLMIKICGKIVPLLKEKKE